MHIPGYKKILIKKKGKSLQQSRMIFVVFFVGYFFEGGERFFLPHFMRLKSSENGQGWDRGVNLLILKLYGVWIYISICIYT